MKLKGFICLFWKLCLVFIYWKKVVAVFLESRMLLDVFRFVKVLSFWLGWFMSICGFFWKWVVIMIVGMFFFVVERVWIMLLFM